MYGQLEVIKDGQNSWKLLLANQQQRILIQFTYFCVCSSQVNSFATFMDIITYGMFVFIQWTPIYSHTSIPGKSCGMDLQIIQEKSPSCK